MSQIHPSGIETSGFDICQPTKAQVEDAARRARDYYAPRPRYRPNQWIIMFLVAAGVTVLVKSLSSIW